MIISRKNPSESQARWSTSALTILSTMSGKVNPSTKPLTMSWLSKGFSPSSLSQPLGPLWRVFHWDFLEAIFVFFFSTSFLLSIGGSGARTSIGGLGGVEGLTTLTVASTLVMEETSIASTTSGAVIALARVAELGISTLTLFKPHWALFLSFCGSRSSSKVAFGPASSNSYLGGISY